MTLRPAPRRLELAELGAADAGRLEAAVHEARLVCFPTDTVYGVGGALGPAVAGALVAAKGREPAKPLQVVFGSLAALEAAVPLSPALLRACRRLLPGPVTLLLPYPAGWRFPPPGSVTGAAGPAVPTLGVRVPAWPAAARVLASFALPLLASSANPSGGAAPASASAVDPGLLAHCDLLLDAGPVSGRASTVVDLSSYDGAGVWRILRPGEWGRDDVVALLAGDGEEAPSP